MQVVASTNKEVDAQIPNYPNLPPQLICQLHNVTMHVSSHLKGHHVVFSFLFLLKKFCEMLSWC
jgi:hypothetical protein